LNVALNDDLDGVFLMALPADYRLTIIDVCGTSMRELALEQLVRLKNIQRVFAKRGQFLEAAVAAIPQGRGLNIQYL
jgi:hypothetical protein